MRYFVSEAQGGKANLQAWTCNKCGALTINSGAHDMWHITEEAKLTTALNRNGSSEISNMKNHIELITAELRKIREDYPA